MSDKELKQEVVQITSELYTAGAITATGGNVSVRSREIKDALWITPSGLFKGSLQPEDLVLVDQKGGILAGNHHPSIEVAFHAGLMEKRADITAVVHSHPPYAITWGLGELVIPPISYDALIIAEYPFIPWQMVGSTALAKAILDAIGDAQIGGAFLCNHGLVTVGKDLRCAADATLNVEHTLKVLHLTAQMGFQPRALDSESILQLQKLIKQRQSYQS